MGRPSHSETAHARPLRRAPLMSRACLLPPQLAGGFVSVQARAEGDEYVVRVAPDGAMSFRSLLRLTHRGVWSGGVGGYLNFRAADGGQQHVRAHGDVQPFAPLRHPVPTSLARVTKRRRRATVPTLGAIRCPLDAPPFDWGLLLDAARAGRFAERRLLLLPGEISAIHLTCICRPLLSTWPGVSTRPTRLSSPPPPPHRRSSRLSANFTPKRRH